MAKIKLKAIRNWLELNKIFFEISSYVILGLMGIILTTNSNKVAENEFNLHKAENLPLFKVTIEPLYDSTFSKYNTEVLKITNEGQAITQKDIEISVYYILEYDSLGFQKVLKIPIYDYFFTWFSNNNFTGNLLTTFGVNNNLDYARVYNHFLNRSHNGVFYFFHKITFVRIEYNDIGNEIGTKYFKIEPYNGFEISEEEYYDFENSSKEFNGEKSYSVDIEGLQIDSLLSTFKNL